MNLLQRSVPVLATLGLVVTGLLTVPGSAATAATTPSCDTQVAGILPSGKLVQRRIHNTAALGEKKTASALPYSVESIYGSLPPEQITGGVVQSMFLHTPGRPAKLVRVRNLDASNTLSVISTVARFRPTPKARTWADSGRFYSYAITPNGALTRFSRVTDGTHYGIVNPKTVKTGQGSIKSLSYMFTAVVGGVRKDFLYATTKGGALKQFQVPWGTPGKPKVTTLRSTGFGAVTSLSLSYCNESGTLASIIAVERGNNRARWWTLAGQFSPKAGNLTRRPLVAPGAEWRLKASY